MIRLRRLNSTRNKTKIHAFPAKWSCGTPDPYLKRSLQRRLHCEDPEQEKRGQKDRNAARIAKKAREAARSLAPARKHAPCSMRLLSCLTASSQSAPIAMGRGDPELRFWRARRGTGGAKRGRFSRRSEGGPPRVQRCICSPRLCAPAGGAFASTVLLRFQCAVCVCSVQEGDACVMLMP